MSKEWEDIDVNRRKDKKVVFESPIVQSIYDGIGILRRETTEILKEIDSTEFKQNIDELDIEEFGETAINHLSEFADDLSSFKDEVLGYEEVPDFVKKSSRDVKVALNRDEDYVRRAKRKLDRIDSTDLLKEHKTNIRVIELCDKAIDVNRKNKDAYYLKGLALVNLEKYDDAIEQFISCLALDESNVDARMAIAQANMSKGDYEDAIDVFNMVLKEDADSFDALKGKAMAYYALKKYGEASECFKKASLIEDLDEESLSIWDECLEN